MKTALLYCSTRPGRMCDLVGESLSAALKARQHQVLLVDPLDHPLMQSVTTPFHWYKKGDAPSEMAQLHGQLSECHGVLLMTTEYNFAPTPATLALLDNFHTETWGGKAVGIVSYSGAAAGGNRAAYVLRNVVAELGMHLVPQSFQLARVGAAFNEDGSFSNPKTRDHLGAFLDNYEAAVKRLQ